MRSEESTVQSDRSTRASLVELTEREHVFVSSVVGQATETRLAQERTTRVGPMPLTPAPATGTQRIDPDEGRRQ